MNMRQLTKDVFKAVEIGSKYEKAEDMDGVNKAFYDAVENLELDYGLTEDEAPGILAATAEKIIAYETTVKKKFTEETFADFIDSKTNKELWIFYAM
jgi:hypothetical protein